MGERARPGVADPGLQVERTALAWWRTGLSVLVAGVVGARLLSPSWGPVAWAISAGAVAAGAVALLGTRSRLSRADRVLRAEPRATWPGAAVLAAFALLCAATGVAALVALLG